MCFAQDDDEIMTSTMKTYVTNFGYVVQYVTATHKRHISTIPMATYLRNLQQHYQ